MTKIIFLNGPPGSGKDTLATFLQESDKLAELGFRTSPMKLAMELKMRTHAAYECYDDDKWEPSLRPHDYYDEVKDLPSDDFLGATPRQAYIGFSEFFFKRMHGDEVFGRLLVPVLKESERLMGSWQGAYRKLLVPISDSGFAVEARPLIREFGAENCLHMRIEADGRGKTFTGDSRTYWDPMDEGIQGCIVHNNMEGDSQWLHDSLTSVLEWLNPPSASTAS